MKQYCRYCVYLCVNNVPYCDVKNKVLSESACKRPNNCKDFVFADVEDEYQDAFGETMGYHPRIRSPKKSGTDMIKDNQFTLPLGMYEGTIPIKRNQNGIVILSEDD